VDEETRRTAHWQSIAGVAFALWALLVPVSAKWVVDSLERMSETQEIAAREASRQREVIEGRLTRLEERQMFITRSLERLEQEHHADVSAIKRKQ